MARVTHSRGALSTNPLKSSAPLGAALAYLGIEGAVPLFHGSQGCTAFALVSLVRHFKEAIPLQTTAMNEVSTILGGADHIEEAIENLQKKAAPKFIGIASTALTETRGEDVMGELREIRARRADFADTRFVYASTPDFEGGLEDGWAKAVQAIIDQLVPESDHRTPDPKRVNLLAGSHLTPADVEELVHLIRAFGLDVTVLPDISTSLDGHIEETWRSTSLGGTPLSAIEALGDAASTLVAGESLRPAAALLEARTGVPFQVFPALTGLKAVDALIAALMDLSGCDAPPAIRRERSRLVDASLDAHFHTGGLKVAIGADPDLLFGLSQTLHGVGAEIVAAVSTSQVNPILATVPADDVLIGDLGDLERLAETPGADVLLTHAHGRQAAGRLGLPLIRAGFPVFDRLGTQDVCRVGYRGTRSFLFEVANTALAEVHAPKPADFGTTPAFEELDHDRSQAAAH